jgi:hypothetical protein
MFLFRCLLRTKVSVQVRGFLCEHFVIGYVCTVRFVNTSPNPQAGGPTRTRFIVLDELFSFRVICQLYRLQQRLFQKVTYKISNADSEFTVIGISCRIFSSVRQNVYFILIIYYSFRFVLKVSLLEKIFLRIFLLF